MLSKPFDSSTKDFSIHFTFIEMKGALRTWMVPLASSAANLQHGGQKERPWERRLKWLPTLYTEVVISQVGFGETGEEAGTPMLCCVNEITAEITKNLLPPSGHLP